MNIKRNIIFELENRKDKDGNLISENIPIRIRITYSGKRVEFSSGFRIDRNKWDNEKRKVKNNCFNKAKQSSSEINSKLSFYETEIQNLFKKCEVEERLPETSDLKKILSSSNLNYLENKEKQFFDYFDEFVSENNRQKNWTPAFLLKYNTVKSHLKSFNPNISFAYLDEKGLNNYIVFLREERNMRNSTIERQLRFVKSFLKWSKEKGYCKNSSFELFKPKLKSTHKKVIFLTQEEIRKIRDLKIPESKNYLIKTRDLFMFLIFSGIRFSDLLNLKKSDIKDDCFEITTVKTADSLIIEFNDTTKSIIEKYKQIPFNDNRALPLISNQKMNNYLKELAELAEINEQIRITYYKGSERIDEVLPKYKLIGTHTGRRTFVVMGLSMGISPSVLMKWTGHADYKSMKPYIDIADNIKANAMKKFDLI